jgi:serine-type D-Ala-D-Ala carboxypeptidase/endopeptidase (penicillin-binding protein 4)
MPAHAISSQSVMRIALAASVRYDSPMHIYFRHLSTTTFRRFVAPASPVSLASTKAGLAWLRAALPASLRATSLAMLVATLSACATLDHSGRESAIAETAIAQMREHDIPEGALGGVVLRVADGRVLWSRNGERAMQPASTIKVLTSIVALETLKPAYRGQALLTTNATQRGDTLDGNLALVGRGSTDFDMKALQGMLRALRAHGVSRIAGDVILDREFFQPPRPYENVTPFDEAPEFQYNLIPDALLLNFNLTQLSLSSNETSLRIVSSPVFDAVEFVSEMTLVDKPCSEWEDLWKIPRVEKNASSAIRVVLLGEYPKNCNANTQINILDRTDYAERAIRSLWRELGGTWSGRAREGVAPKDSRTIAMHESRTLAEVNREINKRSDNPLTRIAYLSLAATRADETNGAQSTTARAEKVVRNWLRSKNIDDTSLVLENGSGLSRTEMISPMTLAQTLREAHRSVWANEFLMSLPIVGIDGAMRNRLKDTSALERGRMKTGGLRNVTSVAGYLPNARGDTMVVVLFLNHDNARGAKGRAVLDAQMREFIELLR